MQLRHATQKCSGTAGYICRQDEVDIATLRDLNRDVRKRDHQVAATGRGDPGGCRRYDFVRSEEHTSELQSLMRISYAVFCLKKKRKIKTCNTSTHDHDIFK